MTGAKRDCIILVADHSMRMVCEAFLSRDGAAQRLGCRPFTADVIVAVGRHDSGVYAFAQDYLREYLDSHAHALALLDANWDGASSAPEMQCDMENRLANNGWVTNNARAIVIDPELENWIWTRSPRLAKELGWPDDVSLYQWLSDEGYACGADGKPEKPKESLRAALRRASVRVAAAWYGDIVAKASVKNCTDPAFIRLRNTLRTWFPAQP